MSEERKQAAENNSFFDGEYREYTKNTARDTCATGTLTLDDLKTMYDTENTSVLRDYETAQLRMSDTVRLRREKTDRRIEELTGQPSEELISNFIFDAEELTVGELIAINEEIRRRQEAMEVPPREPYLSDLIAASYGEPTEKIAVISVPGEAIAADESPFIAIEELESE